MRAKGLNRWLGEQMGATMGDLDSWGEPSVPSPRDVRQDPSEVSHVKRTASSSRPATASDLGNTHIPYMHPTRASTGQDLLQWFWAHFLGFWTTGVFWAMKASGARVFGEFEGFGSDLV